MKSPTIHDVARQAGVSVGAISRVLAKNETVRPFILARVLEAFAALNSTSNFAARALRAKRV